MGTNARVDATEARARPQQEFDERLQDLLAKQDYIGPAALDAKM